MNTEQPKSEIANLTAPVPTRTLPPATTKPLERHDYYVLDEHHNVIPCEMMTWAKAFEVRDARRVARTTLDGDVRISTMFLGLNHQYGDGPPLIFETMIFGGPHSEDQQRCSTWDEALAQHEAMVARAKEAA